MKSPASNSFRFVRRVAATLGLVLLWALIVAAVIFAESMWFPEPNIERGDPAVIESYLVEKLSDAVSSGRLGSASLVLIHDGKITARHGFGIANTGTRSPVLPERTLYQTASVSKAVTAWGVMRLVEEGKIGLDEPVMRYLTRWRFPESDQRRDRVTVRHLLTHTAGLDEGSGLRGFSLDEPMQTLEEALSATQGSTAERPIPVTVAAEPGSRMAYGNANYAILQLMIEEVTQRPFADHMSEAVLRPLGMMNSEFGLDALKARGREVDLAPNFDAWLNEQPRRSYPASAAVALYATAEDLGQFARAFSGGNPVLSRETLELMMTPQGGTSATWGLGPTLYVENGNGGHVVGHDGGAFPAWGAMVRTNPATGNGFVLLVSGGRGAVNRLSHDWVYWETGKVTSEGRRQYMYDRFKWPGWALILAGAALVLLWQLRRSWK